MKKSLLLALSFFCVSNAFPTQALTHKQKDTVEAVVSLGMFIALASAVGYTLYKDLTSGKITTSTNTRPLTSLEIAQRAYHSMVPPYGTFTAPGVKVGIGTFPQQGAFSLR